MTTAQHARIWTRWWWCECRENAMTNAQMIKNVIRCRHRPRKSMFTFHKHILKTLKRNNERLNNKTAPITKLSSYFVEMIYFGISDVDDKLEKILCYADPCLFCVSGKWILAHSHSHNSQHSCIWACKFIAHFSYLHEVIPLRSMNVAIISMLLRCKLSHCYSAFCTLHKISRTMCKLHCTTHKCVYS